MSEKQDTQLVRVYKAAGQLEAHVVKGKLESAGIPVLLQYESQILGITVDGLGEVRILVPEPLAERARHLIAGSDT